MAEESWLADEETDTPETDSPETTDLESPEEPGDVATEEAPLALPGEDATEEEWQDFYRKIGAPEDTSAYEDAFAQEGAQWAEGKERIIEAAHKAGLRVDQLKALTDAYVELQGEQQEGPSTQQVLDELRGDWGREFDRNIGLARQVVQTFGGEELKNALERSGRGNDKALIRTFASMGKVLVNEGLIDGSPTQSQSRDDLVTKATKIMESGAYQNPADPGHQRAVAEVNSLFEKAYPD